ncbi:hypothetical protein [Streptomyces sp. NBC_01244]|uniref:hypothetical protein n=1 Tax=Streptomyces sp. NBC_01244 TaxID=2903797 RepID=UPI002E10F365|nr:hypothetical protein OG247_00620 [Streptomyces sp. NBC_01244]
MAAHEDPRHHARPTPSEAAGERGDREARRQPDEAVVRRPARGGESVARGDGAERQRPGTGSKEPDRRNDQAPSGGGDNGTE